MSEEPVGLYIANHYFNDALELLHRYDLCIKNNYHTFSESRHTKCLIDLRMALECILKGTIAYNQPTITPQELIGLSHTIGKLYDLAGIYIADEKVKSFFNENVKVINKIPVGLRYRLDTWKSRERNNLQYYNIIRNSSFLCELRDNINQLITALDDTLKTHSKIISISELRESIFKK